MDLNLNREVLLLLVLGGAVLAAALDLRESTLLLVNQRSRAEVRLNERHGQLERVLDTLDVTLAEEEAAFEGTLKARREAFEAKAKAQEAAARDAAAKWDQLRAEADATSFGSREEAVATIVSSSAFFDRKVAARLRCSSQTPSSLLFSRDSELPLACARSPKTERRQKAALLC